MRNNDNWQLIGGTLHRNGVESYCPYCGDTDSKRKCGNWCPLFTINVKTMSIAPQQDNIISMKGGSTVVPNVISTMTTQAISVTLECTPRGLTRELS